MATYNAADLLTRPVRGTGEGTVIPIRGSMTPAGGALNDVWRIARIPAGSYVLSGQMKNADLDSNGSPTLEVKNGNLPNDGSAGDDDAFGSAITQLQAAAGPTNMNFSQGVYVEKDSFLVVTVTTAAATYAAGVVDVVMYAETFGPK